MSSEWLKVSLSGCCEIISGATPKSSVKEYWGGEVFWATPRDLSDLRGPYIADTPRKITEAGLRDCGARLLPPQSVLLSSRAPIGHVAINTVPMATNQGFKSLAPDPLQVDAKYLYHWLRVNRSYLESLGNGATFKEISKEVISRVEIPLPQIVEQRRIAAVLDQTEILRAKRHEALAQLDELAQSIFLDMFGDSTSRQDGWMQSRLRDVVSEFRYGTSNKSQSQGVPTLRIPNVTNSEIDISDLKLVPTSPSELERLRLLEGDLLIVRTNGNPNLVGRCAVYDHDVATRSGRPREDFIYASYLIRARPRRDEISSVYLREFMLSPAGRRALRARCKTSAGQFNINAESLGTIEVPLPPLDLQQEYARRVEAVAKLKTSHRAHLAELDALFASLQYRAFRGEL